MSPEEGRARAAAKDKAYALAFGLGLARVVAPNDVQMWADRFESVLHEAFVALASDEARREREAVGKWLDERATKLKREATATVNEAEGAAKACEYADLLDRDAHNLTLLALWIRRNRHGEEPAIPDSRISNMSRLKEALAREGEIVEAQPEKPPRDPRRACGYVHEGVCAHEDAYRLPGPTKEARPDPPPRCENGGDGCTRIGVHKDCCVPAPEARVSPEPTEAEEKGDTRPPDPELLKALKASLRSARDSE